MKISKILAGMSAAAIVASMAMIPASAAGTKLNVSDDLAKIGRQTQDDLFAVFFNGDESEGAVNKDAISDLGAVYGASFTIKVDNNDWNTIGGGGSINFNSKSGGWNAKDWAGGSWVEDDKPKDTLYSSAASYVYKRQSLLQQLHLQQQLAQHLQRLAQQLQQLHLPQQLLTTQQLQAQQLVLHLLA